MKKNKTVLLSLIIIFFILSCSPSNKNNSEGSEIDSVSDFYDTLSPSFDESGVEEDVDLLIDQYQDPDRSKWQNPEMVLDKLGPLQGKTIADIGSGTGYFTFLLARNAEKVIAIDIEEQFLEYIEEQKIDYPVSVSDAIETRLTVENDPRLMEGEADIVLMVNVYSYLENRVEYLKKIRHGLNQNGTVLIVDFKLGEMPVGPSEELKIGPQAVVEELEEADFSIVESDTTILQYQYLIKAKK